MSDRPEVIQEWRNTVDQVRFSACRVAGVFKRCNPKLDSGAIVPDAWKEDLLGGYGSYGKVGVLTGAGSAADKAITAGLIDSGAAYPCFEGRPCDVGVRGGAFKPYKFDNVRYPAAQLDESQSGTYRPIGDGRVGRFTCQPGFTGLLALTGKGFRRGWSKGTPQTFTCS